MQEILTVVVGGTRYTAWTRALIEASIKTAARSFRLEIAAEMGGEQTSEMFCAGTELDIYANDDLLISGFVDRDRPSFDATSAKIVISGRSKSGDLVDSSAVHDTGLFENMTIVEIGEQLDITGIGITSDLPLEKIPKYQLTPGETIFAALNKLSRAQGLVMAGLADGSTMLTSPGRNPKRHPGGLFEGKNMKSGEADRNFSGRYSRYIVRGQGSSGHGPDSLEIEAVARDSAIKRSRTLIVVQDDETTKNGAKKTAKNRRDRAAGAAISANITVQGLRDEAGKLWTPGHMVWTESKFLSLAQDMLIETVVYGQDCKSGTEGKLSLVDPRTYGGKKKKGNKSKNIWHQDDGDAE